MRQGGGEALGQFLLGAPRDQKPAQAAGRIGQGGRDGVQPIEPHRAPIGCGGGILGAGAMSLLAHFPMKPAPRPLASGARLS